MTGHPAHEPSPATAAAAVPPTREVAVATGKVSSLDSGTGAPAVVFIGGAGGLAIAWEPVRAQVAGFTRAFAYDRPGYGASTPRRGPAVVSPAALAAELRDLLAAAQVPEPVVLVAHSFGGFIARAFVAAYSGSVAGLVLVDADHEDEWTDRYPDAHRRGLALAGRSLAVLAAAATVGVPQALARLPFVPLGGVDRLPPQYRRTARQLGARRAALRAAAAEFAGLQQAAGQMRRLPDLGDLPLVVVAHGRPGPTAPGVSAAEAARLEQLAQDSQHALATLSRRGLLVVADAGHEMHIDAPDVVVRAVRDVLAERQH